MSCFITHSDKFAVTCLLVYVTCFTWNSEFSAVIFFKEQSLYIILVYTSNVIHEYNEDQQLLLVMFFNVVNVLQNTKESNLSLSGDIRLGAVFIKSVQGMFGVEGKCIHVLEGKP